VLVTSVGLLLLLLLAKFFRIREMESYLGKFWGFTSGWLGRVQSGQ
jgi:hypothetical protein